MGDIDIHRVMEMATQGDREALERFWGSLSPDDRLYASGYVDGYVEAVRHLTSAAEDAAMGYNAHVGNNSSVGEVDEGC